jgi:hypothetical protein
MNLIKTAAELAELILLAKESNRAGFAYLSSTKRAAIGADGSVTKQVLRGEHWGIDCSPWPIVAEAQQLAGTHPLKSGDIVRYSKPRPREEELRFLVLEAHLDADPPRIHMALISEEFSIPPIETVSPEDLIRSEQ